MNATLNLLDLIFISFALIFVIAAFFRGFVKEIFSTLNWLAAFVISYLLAPYAAQLILLYSKNKLVADIASRSIIFILVLIICGISTSGLCKDLKEKISPAFDRSLGVFYGLIKTLLIFGFIYSVFTNAYGFLAGKKVEENSPQFPVWLKEAKCHGILRTSGAIIDPAVKLIFNAVVKNFNQAMPKPEDYLKEKLDKKINEVIKQKENVVDEGSIDNPSSSINEDSGYNKKDIEKMNHLIDIIQK